MPEKTPPHARSNNKKQSQTHITVYRLAVQRIFKNQAFEMQEKKTCWGNKLEFIINKTTIITTLPPHKLFTLISEAIQSAFSQIQLWAKQYISRHNKHINCSSQTMVPKYYGRRSRISSFSVLQMTEELIHGLNWIYMNGSALTEAKQQLWK